MNPKLFIAIIPLVLHFLAVPCQTADDFQCKSSFKKYPFLPETSTVIGQGSVHMIKDEDTLLDIAREYGLGFNELILFHPEINPWTPPAGKQLTLPSFWIVPERRNEQIIINIPELRLYFFDKDNSTVQTCPVGLGKSNSRTPVGRFYITRKKKDPTWHIPQSMRKEYNRAAIPPGPKNPLGKYLVGFSAGDYAIHGTNIPWGVGRLVSHGCIRCYPEHIRILYPQIQVGEVVRVIYEPIKFGQKKGQIFVEVHPDLYGRIPDFKGFALNKLENYEFAEYVDLLAYKMAVEAMKGVPTNITDPIKILSKKDIELKEMYYPSRIVE